MSDASPPGGGSGDREVPRQARPPETNDAEAAAEAVDTSTPEAAAQNSVESGPPSAPIHSEAASPEGRRPVRPSLQVARESVSREHRGFSLTLEPSDLASLRELPGSRGKSDEELGAEFLAAHADKLVSALTGDLEGATAVRVLVDPYSRQAFLAVEDRVRGIVSF